MAIGKGGFGGGWSTQKGRRGSLPNGASRVIKNPAVNTKNPTGKVPGATRVVSNPAIKPQAPVNPYRPVSFIRKKEGKLTIGVVGKFARWPWGQHPDEAYMADALERLECAVARFDQDGGSFGGPVDIALFTGHPASWSKMHHFPAALSVLWTLDWLPDFPTRRPIIEAAKRASLFMSSDQFDWKARGIHNHRYLPGACETRTRELKPQPRIPCAFVGALYNERRQQIAALIRKRGGVVLNDAGSWVYGEELSRFVQSVKVVVGDNCRNDVQGYWSTRNYIIPGAGGFLLTPSVPGLNLQFDIGKHLDVYSSMKELDKKLGAWIQNDEGRERIRRDGYSYVRSKHSWLRRAETFLVHVAERIEA